ncbi:MAG: ATP-binding cassette domain-containing protein [Leptospiraceae bacterium]|nr:ATP-binding cassette domain-containing protein [Leptospiraceae bacterium]
MRTLIQIQSIHKSFGARQIFDGAALTIHEGQKIGVIGRNGAGKSTLLRLMIGTEELEGGEIVKDRNLRLAYLSQVSDFKPDETVLAYLMRSSEQPDWQCGKIAGRFGLKNELLALRMNGLSGGFQMRARLCSLLLTEPELLLLDEPSNYLDLNTLLLLEDFLRDFKGGFLLVSHDREFLQNTCDMTLDVDDGGLFLYPGSLPEYLEFKAEKTAELERQNQNIANQRKELEAFVERFRAKASKASQAQSKLKQLHRLQPLEISAAQRRVQFRIPGPVVHKGSALVITDLDIGYANKRVASQINLNIGRGEHVAILGANGQGKSTLLKTVMGFLPSLNGSFRWDDASVGFYAQHVYESMDRSLDVESYLRRAAESAVTPQEILNMAGSFLFQGDDAYKPLTVLSGGELSRLCLAGLLLGQHDVLVLDEPTNHLDFETVEALGFALREYSGTVLFVSHDRTFVNLIADRIISITDGAAVFYPGNYADYVASLQAGEQRQIAGAESGGSNKSGAECNPGKTEQPQPVNSWQKRKDLRKQRRELEKEQQALENESAALEAARSTILERMQKAGAVYDPADHDSLASIESNLHSNEENWLKLQDELDQTAAALESLD